MKSETERFWSRVKRGTENECWLWASTVEQGYGRVHFGGRYTHAHRAAFALNGGALKEGLTIDHTCGNTLCVNPRHLEQVSRAENTRRFYRKQTACKHGHPFDEENTRIDTRGRRSCRACNRIRYFRNKERGLQ